jgi:hypothetical protein
VARSRKSRSGTRCKRWKDSVLESRSQKQAWAKSKRIRSQQERAREKAKDAERCHICDGPCFGVMTHPE